MPGSCQTCEDQERLNASPASAGTTNQPSRVMTIATAATVLDVARA
jgi:hypothetical protein